MNSRRHSGRVQELGKSGKRGQDREEQDVFLKLEGGLQEGGCFTKGSGGIVATDL